MKTIKKIISKAKYFKYAPAIFMLAFAVQFGTVTAYANIASSKIGTGLTKLITDLTNFLMIIAPVAMVVMLIYFFIRKGMADDMDQKKWNSRIITAIISCVGAFLASVIINLATQYFS